MAGPRPLRLALTDSAGRLRVLAVHESDQPVEAVPQLDAADLEDGPLARLTWPTWLADGRLLVTATTPAGRPGLHLVRPGQAGTTVLYRPPPGLPVQIAPAVPHYANPSPDGRAVALVTPGSDGLVLFLIDLAAPGDPVEVVRGAPIFTAWSPAGDALLAHVGTVIHRLDRHRPTALTTVGLNCVDLRVPAWSADGQSYATIRHGETRNAVVLLHRDGHHLDRIGAVRGGGALAWSPRGDLLAVSSMEMAGTYAGIDVIDPRSSQTQRLVRDSVLLWLWSPDGRRIAYLRRAGGEGQIAWRVVGLDGRPLVSSAPFYPSPLFAVVITFFDQYLLSTRLWSPDGRYLAAAGRVATNGPPADLVGGAVLLFDTAGRRPLRTLCPGEIATWQW